MSPVIDLPTNAEQVRYLLPWVRDLILRSSPLRDRAPWMPYAAASRIRSRLGPDSRVFEYGSGGSTLWFMDRGCQVVSVEHDESWLSHVAEKLTPEQKHRAHLILARPERRNIDDQDACFEQYINAIDAYNDHWFDVVLVDGRARSACLDRSWPKVRVGGLLVLDDSERARYRRAMDSLPGGGRQDYYGPTAYSRWYRQATIWEKTE